MKEYDKSKILKVYYTILIIDSCGDIYDEICKGKNEDWDNIIEPAKRIIEMKKSDKELGDEYGVWDYRIAKHEEDNDSDWQSEYKIYKYKRQWRYKRVA